MIFNTSSQLYPLIDTTVTPSQNNTQSSLEVTEDKSFNWTTYLQLDEKKNESTDHEKNSISIKTPASTTDQINNIHNCCALLELKTLLNGNDTQKIAHWIMQNKKGIQIPSYMKSTEFLDDISRAREMLVKENLLVPKVGTALSDIVTFALGLKGQKDSSQVNTLLTEVFTTPQKKLEAKAHWINAEKIPLKSAGLSHEDLKAIAPYLQYVDCTSVNLNNPQNFIDSCSNAYHLFIHSSKLTELKRLPPHLYVLDCSDCPITTLNLSNNKTLRAVNCSNCPITTLNLSKNVALRGLDCSRCPISILDLSKNKRLQTLYCSRCPITTLDLSHNVALQNLNCSNCSSITTLDLSHNVALKNLNCCDCLDLAELDVSKSIALQNLNYSACPKLLALDISKNVALEKLDCKYNPITTLDLSTNIKLQELDCRYCLYLTELDISKNVAIRKINCRYCLNLTELDVSKNVALRKINCSYCKINILNFSENQVLKLINCNNCPNLISLGDFLSNTLEKLRCENCPRLTQLPQAPPTATVYSGSSRCGNLNRFDVNPLEIEQKPIELLLRLGEILLQNKPFPNIVYRDPLTGQQNKGVDAGGLRRQFIYDLSQRLFKNPIDFPFITNPGTTRGNFPTLIDPENNQKILALRTLARLIALIATSKALITGPILSQSFYNTVLTLAKNPELKTFKTPLSEVQKKQLYLIAQYGYKTDEEVPHDEKIFFAIGDPLAIIAQELKTVLQQKLDDFTLDEFIAKVEGIEINSEMLLGMINEKYPRIKFDIDRAPQIEGFLKKFINKFNKTITLTDFVKFVVGSPCLGMEEQIKVYISRDLSIDHLPITHTCFQSIEFPPYTDYDTFEKKLLNSLEAKETFGLQ